jgi:N-acetylneuraminic acid mutarotase
LSAAVLGGKMYVIGGCSNTCESTQARVYDPASNSWSMVAPYPEPVSFESCGAIAGRLYCAGGTSSIKSSTHTWAYDPAANTWSARADMPIDLWGSVYAAANGMLLVSGGITGNRTVLTNRGFAYDPATNIWNVLPNANSTVYLAGSACGLYRIGGKPGLGTWPYETPPTGAFEMLPGFSDCASNADVAWLSTSIHTATLKPGQRVTVTVTVDASVAAVTAPGRYTAALATIADTPYPGTTVPVTMTITPPKTDNPATLTTRTPG